MSKGRCPLCKSDDSAPVVCTDFNLTGGTAKSYRVVQCLRCDMRYLDPLPRADELAAYYREDYPAYALGRENPNSCSVEQASIHRRFARIAEHRLSIVRRETSGLASCGPLLDVGCGNGAFLLEFARQTNGECWGLDIEECHLAKSAKSHTLPLRFMKGNLKSSALPARYFGLITFWHSLEHDGDPVGTLKRVSELLRPGGFVLAEVPNSSGLIARMCGSCWLGWDLPRHLVHFIPTTLRRSARRAGLSRIRVLHEYTLNPICLSPLLASLSLWHQRQRGRKRLKRPNYHKCDGTREIALQTMNGFERILGGNGLLLVARSPHTNSDRRAA